VRAPQPGEWLTYGREYNNQRFSPLARINRDNVSRLTARWRLQLEVSQQGACKSRPSSRTVACYVTTSHNVGLAFDLRTRAQLWRYEHKLDTVRFCCGPNNRGVALGHDLVYMATLDAHVVALDACHR
jgi:glucose dehydrogenase